jgi:hypothetical protein
MVFRAPLLGYNTNVRHKGRLYHIQTEDSGIGHPHIITHLFADGGRIVGSKKTSYAEHLSAVGLQDTVKKLMQAQHKAMFIALRDGHFDESGPSEIPTEHTATIPVAEALGGEGAGAAAKAGAPRKDAEARGSAREQIKDERTGKRPEPPEPPRPLPPPPLYQGTLAAAGAPALSAVALSGASTRQSIFGGDMTSEKSLDEVILSYLATDDKDG